jgi:N-acetylmuramoyl-L-alanine amidase
VGAHALARARSRAAVDRDRGRALIVRWLRCRFHIPITGVIGHNESLTSPYHREDVPALRSQTHSDFNHSDMQIYRARLRAAGPC